MEVESQTSALRNTKIIDPQRKKILLKKLEKIKLNRYNYLNLNISAFYNVKLKKLKDNNVALAKALAEQRQVSQSWYDEVVSLKEELHETRGDLLRYHVSENSDYDFAIQNAAERLIRDIAHPLESAVKDCLDHVLGVVDGMTKVKQLVASLLKISNEKLSSSSGSNGARPLLSRTTKSPRKNVVHPMVEGHVLQPASIHLPRMTLEERRRYRLQERADNSEAAVMDVISEHSLSLAENDPAEISDINITGVSQTLEAGEGALPTEVENPPSETTPTQEFRSPNTSSELSPQKPSTTKGNITADLEDPLEGSSWMHLKQRRGPQRQKSKPYSGLRNSAPFPFHYDSSSDSDAEEPCKSIRNRKSRRPVSGQKGVRNLNSSSDESLPILCLVRMDEKDSQACRRSTRRTRMSQKIKNTILDSHLVKTPVLASSPTKESENNSALDGNNLFHCLSTEKKKALPVVLLERQVTLPTMIISTTSSSQLSFTSSTALNTSNSSIITPTKSKLVQKHCSSKSSDLVTSSSEFFLNRRDEIFENSSFKPKPKALLKPDASIPNDDVFPPNQMEKDFSNSESSFESSKIQTTFSTHNVLEKGKENVPPEIEVITEEKSMEMSMNLKNVSIVVEDIMKTHLPDLSLDSLGKESEKEKTSIKGGSSTPKSASESRKRKACKRKEDNPVKKVAKTKRKINSPTDRKSSQFDRYIIPVVDNKSRHPSIKSRNKQPVKPKRKSIENMTLPMSTFCESNSHDYSPVIDLTSETNFVCIEESLGIENNLINGHVEESMEEAINDFNFPSNEAKDPLSELGNFTDGIADAPNFETLVPNHSVYTELLEEVATLFKDNLEYEELEDPPAILAGKIKENSPTRRVLAEANNDVDDEQISVVNSISHPSPFKPVSTSGEIVKTRPRRAATKVVSLKEPSLNKKLRQENSKGNLKKLTSETVSN